MGRWIGKTTVRDASRESGLRIAETEIDIAAVSRDKKQYLVGEYELKGRPFTYGEYLDTRAKLPPQKENADFFYALFSESGFDDKVREAAKKEAGIYLYSLEQIVAGK